MPKLCDLRKAHDFSELGSLSVGTMTYQVMQLPELLPVFHCLFVKLTLNVTSFFLWFYNTLKEYKYVWKMFNFIYYHTHYFYLIQDWNTFTVGVNHSFDVIFFPSDNSVKGIMLAHNGEA